MSSTIILTSDDVFSLIKARRAGSILSDWAVRAIKGMRRINNNTYMTFTGKLTFQV
jgi:hypothetical protein